MCVSLRITFVNNANSMQLHNDPILSHVYSFLFRKNIIKLENKLLFYQVKFNIIIIW